MSSDTPLVDALENEMHSHMTKRLRIWKLARQLERGQRMLEARLEDVKRELAVMKAENERSRETS